jgi:hypothetical protein
MSKKPTVLERGFEAQAKALVDFGYPGITAAMVKERHAEWKAGNELTDVIGKFCEKEFNDRPEIFGTPTNDAKAASEADKPATQAKEPEAAPPAGAKAASAPAKARTPRENSKTAQLIAALRSEAGATVDELARKFGWQAHTTRAAISTLPKKDASLKATSEKVEGRGRVYRLPEAAQ